jgi:hypothetical protein
MKNAIKKLALTIRVKLGYFDVKGFDRASTRDKYLNTDIEYVTIWGTIDMSNL